MLTNAMSCRITLNYRIPQIRSQFFLAYLSELISQLRTRCRVDAPSNKDSPSNMGEQ